MRLLGPNCVGIVNTENQLATIEVLDASLDPGPVAIIAQSGVFGNILLDYLPEVGLKISKVATMGNKIDLDEVDFLEYFADDPQTRVILIYQEGTRDGRRLLQALRQACRKKPVVILKSGRTPLGKMATLSHTASLSGEDGLYDAAFSQAGAIRAASLADMIEITKVLTTQPPMPGKRVGVLTTSGSLGAMTADALFEEGLQLASWSRSTFEKVRQAAPDWVNVKNPMDIGPSGIFPTALEADFFRSQCRRVCSHPGDPLCRHRNLAARGGPDPEDPWKLARSSNRRQRESRWSRFCSEERDGSISSRSWAGMPSLRSAPPKRRPKPWRPWHGFINFEMRTKNGTQMNADSVRAENHVDPLTLLGRLAPCSRRFCLSIIIL